MFKFLIILSFISTNLSDIQLIGKCGFPGRPHRAHLEQNNKVVPVDKLEFNEGEEVTIVCKDYWPPPQKRKCVKGKWSGMPSRCGYFSTGFLMNASKAENISDPKHPNVMFKNSVMKYRKGYSPSFNVFSAMDYKGPRFRVYDSSKYRWTFNFTDPAVKLYVRTNFVFVNFTLLPNELQNNFTFNISVNVSPFRNCVLGLQKAIIDDMWATNALKMENHFICDSVSQEGWKRDVENPGDYLIVETKSSIDIPHDIITIYFGRSYNTERDPLCGVPEFSFAHNIQTIVKDKEYKLECNNDIFESIYSTNNSVSETTKHKLKCGTDMKWNGSYPLCVPKMPCPIDNLNGNNETVITSLNGLYLTNDTYYEAIDGTEVKYVCSQPNHVFMNENSDKRFCLENGLWNGTTPLCYDPNKSSKFSVWLLIGILFIALILILCLTGVLFYIYTKRMRNRIIEQIETQNRDEKYDDILNDNMDDKLGNGDNYYTLPQEYQDLSHSNENSNIYSEQPPEYLVIMSCEGIFQEPMS